MKRILAFFALLLTLTFPACKKDTIAYRSAFDKSEQAWLAFKASSGNSYDYLVASGSWTGYGTETLISVRGGIIIARHYVAKMPKNDGTNQFTVVEEWQEGAAQVGTHQKGATPQTLDEVYALAKTDWLLKRDKAKNYFETNNNGMISSCGYTQELCADDCFTGITITSIKAVQ